MTTIQWTVSDAGDFATVAAQWDALNDAGTPSPLLHSDFIGPALASFGSGGEKIVFGSRGDRPVVGAIVARSGSLVANVFQPSQAPIAAWVHNEPANALCDHEALRALAARLGATTMMINISQVDPELVARPASSAAITTSDSYDTGRVTIAGTFDAYWAARGKNLRANMKKQRNKLDAEGVALRVDCVVDPAHVAAAIADYGRLESASWKASGGTAVSGDNAQGRFYRDVFERFCARGMGRIYRCFYDDRLAAMDLCIVHAGVLVILKTSFDETIKGTSPAFLMRHDYFPRLFERQDIARVEFYGRVMEWHTKWTQEIRTLYHVTAYRWPWVAKLDGMRRARAQVASPADPAPTTTESTDA
jgi:CelD/BcsL family acetyltransferase involved in cellulose biosynthesis